MLTLGLVDATMMGPNTMPPVIAKACCSPMIRASRTGRGSLTAKKGGSLSVVSLRQYGHLGCSSHTKTQQLEAVRESHVCEQARHVALLRLQVCFSTYCNTAEVVARVQRLVHRVNHDPSY